MILGQYARAAGHAFKGLGLTLALLLAPQPLLAQEAAPVAPAAAEAPIAAPAPVATPAAAAADAAPAAAAAPAGSYTPMPAEPGKGMPVARGLDVQKQFSPIGETAQPFHNALLIISVVIALFVLLLLLFVMVKFRRGANPVPSKTSHNTLLEVVWTGVPILILVAIAFPSLSLLAKQFEPAPAKALTIKVIGNQWYWTYAYPDNGGFEVVSNMLKEQNEVKAGERARTDADGPAQLAVDYRMVVPVGEPIRLQVTAADVIHSFAVPSLWFKIDGVPGRINEKVLQINEPGVYFGQCSELCGVRHGYMPIAIEALPRDKYNAWVMTQAGGAIDGQPKPAETPAAAAPAPAAPASPAPAA